jgi:hypothetical protein
MVLGLLLFEINPSNIPGLILRLRSGQAPGVCSGLILSGAFYPALKAGVWRRRSIKKNLRFLLLTSISSNGMTYDDGVDKNK